MKDSSVQQKLRSIRPSSAMQVLLTLTLAKARWTAHPLSALRQRAITTVLLDAVTLI
ncbi:hypothetical protein ACFQDN_05880 [Pseudomonas asuensis]|uniref:hypothetical protein n=1 Tax=Pseudomonas asuensis TaxID=1825787 RepID=UPI00166BDC69|nr:hypothetical protein [Pseudomonas asuensis]